MPVIPLPSAIPAPGSGEGFGPCAAWEPLWCVDLPTGSEMISGHAIQMATEILWARSGMRYDQCALTIRPCRQSCDGWGGGLWGGAQWWEIGTPYPYPALIAGNWYNLTCGDCSNGCSCSRVESILLPGPVTSITAVKVDGVTLAASAYRLDDWRKLVRIDGGIWPICNDLNLADSEPGTWSVSLVYGQPVPTMGRMAVGELALQIMYACLGMDCCVLPYNVQQIARQGVTIEYPKISEIYGTSRDGFTVNRLGLQFCDMFIDAANPAGLRTRSRFYTPDVPGYTIAGSGA